MTNDHINGTETTQQTQVSKLHKESFIHVYVFIMLQQSISSDKKDFSIQYFITVLMPSFKYTLLWMCVDNFFFFCLNSGAWADSEKDIHQLDKCSTR